MTCSFDKVIHLRRLVVATLTRDSIKRQKFIAQTTKCCESFELQIRFRCDEPNFAPLQVLLNEMLIKNELTHFGDFTAEELNLVHKPQSRLHAPPIRASIPTKRKDTLHTGTRNMQCGCVLLQKYFKNTP